MITMKIGAVFSQILVKHKETHVRRTVITRMMSHHVYIPGS